MNRATIRQAIHIFSLGLIRLVSTIQSICLLACFHMRRLTLLQNLPAFLTINLPVVYMARDL